MKPACGRFPKPRAIEHKLRIRHLIQMDEKQPHLTDLLPVIIPIQQLHIPTGPRTVRHGFCHNYSVFDRTIYVYLLLDRWAHGAIGETAAKDDNGRKMIICKPVDNPDGPVSFHLMPTVDETVYSRVAITSVVSCGSLGHEVYEDGSFILVRFTLRVDRVF